MMNKGISRRSASASLVLVVAALATGVNRESVAAALVQCPGDTDGDAIPDAPSADPNVTCMHLGAGDGFVTMGDKRPLYTFGFNDLTGVAESTSLDAGILGANFPAPSIVLEQGQEFYLTLTNYGMITRPDLADPHSLHFHGFPNASDIFDGIPDSTVSINMGSSLTYYYNIVEPGTYMYHCHVEATEHMQMGMLGNLYVRPAQNGDSYAGYTTFAYNDGDGSTGYDIEVPIQIGSFDARFHDASRDTQPLPFAEMKDTYGMLNGRGYPDTADARTYDFPSTAGSGANADAVTTFGSDKLSTSQPVSSRIEAGPNQKILLRISNLNVTNYYTLTALGLTMRVVGTGARILKGGGENNGTPMYYDTASVTLGGGESVDAIIDTSGVPAGTYYLYTTNLNFLSNGDEDFGGMMTEIHIL